MTCSVLRVSRVVADLDRAEAFYAGALSFRRAGRGPLDPATREAVGLHGAAEQSLLHLGAETIALVRLEPPAAPYPPASQSNDLWFQHIAVVVSDMAAAYRHLRQWPGWEPISRGGPQELPPENGRVRAFKFRDADAHPVELIWFPPGQGRDVWHHSQVPGPFLGIDHSALAVSDTGQSLAFYRALGFAIGDATTNGGPAQSQLDGISNARLRVSPLRLGAGPGLELLGYDPPGRANHLASSCCATDWVTLAGGNAGAPPELLRDPDGHRLILV